MIKNKVYLAGGMKGDWQSRVIEYSKDEFEFFNPQDHKLKKPKEYTGWDLFYLDKSDICFAYLEKDNPSGIGLSLEIGYAKALGKMIILVDEKSGLDYKEYNKFGIVRNSSTVVFDNLEEGLEYLNSF